MGPNIYTLQYRHQLQRKESPISVEYVLAYAWHGTVDEVIPLDDRKPIITQEWLRNALGAVDNTFENRSDCFEALVKYGCTTPIAGPRGLATIHSVPEFLWMADVGLRVMQRKNNVPSYNEARRQLNMPPYTTFADIVSGTELKESEMVRLFGSIENVDFYTGLTIDNTKTKGPAQFCEMTAFMTSTVAFAIAPILHGGMQPFLPRCILDEVDKCQKDGFLSTLLRRHMPGTIIPTIWTFSVLKK
jgi:hypothetical protein